MLSKTIKTYLVATSLAPICLSLGYVFFEQGKFSLCVISVCIFILISSSALYIVNKSKDKLESLPIQIKKAKSADKEIMGFFVAYVLPILFKDINVDISTVFVFISFLAFIIWGTHSFQVNPLLGLFGYHFYDVDSEDGISFLLMTKRKIVNVKHISRVVQLTEYLVVDLK